MKKRIFSLVLALVMCLSISASACAAENDKQDKYSVPTTIKDTLEERVVVQNRDGKSFRAEYHKRTNVLVMTISQEGKDDIIITTDFNIELERWKARHEQEDEFLYTGQNVVKPRQSKELGFGYVIGDPICTYACSQKLVDDGVYPNRGINLLKTSNTDAQDAFRDAVEDLIDAENKLELTQTHEIFVVIFVTILACLGEPEGAANIAISALDLTFEASTYAHQAACASEKCYSLFSMMWPYRII